MKESVYHAFRRDPFVTFDPTALFGTLGNEFAVWNISQWKARYDPKQPNILKIENGGISTAGYG